MPGTFSKANRPSRPGAYFNFVAVQATPPPPGLAGIVCIPFTNDWGPSEVPVLLRSFDDYRAVFGDSLNTVGYRDVREAFQGEGLSGFGGAGAVLAYRMSGSAAAKAAHIFTNTTPATALTLTALFEGTRGNALNVTVQAAAGIAGSQQLLIYDGATLVESYTYVQTDIANLAAQINAAGSGSDWVSAVANVTGVALTTVTNAALTGGNGGETLLLADWTNMMAAIEIQRFSVLAAEWPIDNPTYTALASWIALKRQNGKMFRTVVGGALNESSATALARAALFNSEGVINIGQGSVQDVNLGVLSTSQLAPRVAGAVASRGESRGLTYSRFTDLTLLVGATDIEIAQAFGGGLVVLARDSNLDAPVRIDKGITTYITTTNPAKPYLIYRNPKFVATMDAIQMDLQAWAEANVIGQLQVNGATRAYVRAYINSLMKAREDLGIIQPGWTVQDDNNPAATPQDEFMQFAIGLTFGRSAEQVYFTASVG